MTIALATAWNPRGEIDRFLNLLPVLQEAYTGIAISLPPEAEDSLLTGIKEINIVKVVETPDWSWGRYFALESALQFAGAHIQYADFDRLLRWVETRRAEWRQVLQEIPKHDCLIIGRTPGSYQTHPQALVRTEAISNQVVSFLLDQPLDVSAGSKGFSRSAAEFILVNCEPGHALGTDSEWPLTLMRGGFQVDSIEVEGLDWESADRYQQEAADTQSQRDAAKAYDQDPKNWASRVAVSEEIVRIGLATFAREIPHYKNTSNQELEEHISAGEEEFDFDSVFEVDDYLYFYQEYLTPERTRSEVDSLEHLVSLEKGCRILDLACGFGRHANELSARGYDVTGVDLTPGFLDIARKRAAELEVPSKFIQMDMRQIEFEREFDRVLLLFTSFGYFEDRVNKLVLENVSRALKPGGMLILDSHNRDVFLKHLQPYMITEKEEDLLIDRNRFDTKSGRWYNRRIVIRDGVRKDKPFFVQLYNPTEITRLIAEVGMEVLEISGGYESQPLSNESSRMVIIARKP